MRRVYMVPEPEGRSPLAAKGGRLDSWKEIAGHLRRGITTVQRWEREEGLPIHRHLHSKAGSVFAYVGELDRWLAGREPNATAGPSDGSIPSTADGTYAMPGGAMPLESPYYVARAADQLCRDAIAQRSAIVLVKGARQVGKSSLLARALAGARHRSAAVAFTDIQALAFDDLRSPKAFYQALGRSIADQIRPSPSILNTWNDHDSPNTNFSRYMQRLISGVHQHVVWGLDEVDRLVGHAHASEVFALFRSWHNLRALDPAAPWGRLTLVMAYATECQLLIPELNESPFNVGVRTTLDDFHLADVTMLNERHGSLLDSPAGVQRLMELVGGHPYLLACAFDELRRGASLESLECDARREAGPLGEHLRRLRQLLEREPARALAMHAVLSRGSCRDRDSFYRLRSAGIIHGTSPGEARPRCGLYKQLTSEPS